MTSTPPITPSKDDDVGFKIEVSGQVATLTLGNGPVTTVNPTMIEALIDQLPTVTTDPQIRCLVVRGHGRVFVGGADIRVMRRLDPNTYTAMRRWTVALDLLAQAPKPVVAAINGHALGGGAELALACDLRIMHSEATFGFPEINLGIFPGASGSQRLPRLVGPHKAKLFMMTGQRFSADEALSHGLVDLVAQPAEFETIVADHVSRLAQQATAVIGLIKSAVDTGIELPYKQALEVEGEHVMANIKLEDAAEGLQAFLDKRNPVFRGH